MRTLGLNPNEEDLQQMIFTVDYDGKCKRNVYHLFNHGTNVKHWTFERHLRDFWPSNIFFVTLME